jgi:ParB-like chromosome segregation protein Spo0J
MTNRPPFHPVTEIFPLMEDGTYQALVEDISRHGQKEPILVLDGQVIDGRHRFRACAQLGLEPWVQEVDAEEGDPLALVISLNLHRRHLTESQRAMVATRLATLKLGANQHAQICAPSQRDAADLVGVSRRLVQHARTVVENGSADLVAAVDRGEVAVSTAAELSRLPAETQREVLTKSPEEIRAIAREWRRRVEEEGVCGPTALKRFDQLAAEQGLSGIEQIAVVEVIKQETPKLPSPTEARSIAGEALPGTVVLARDGRYYGAREATPEETAQSERWFALREGLESLCRIDCTAEALLACVPAYQHANLTAWLTRAMPILSQFDQLWRTRHA